MPCPYCRKRRQNDVVIRAENCELWRVFTLARALRSSGQAGMPVVLKGWRDLGGLLEAHDEECIVVAATAEDDYGVASSMRVLPPSWRASSMPASARFIHSVTRSSVSSPGRAVDSATTALMVRSCAPQEGWTVEAT